MLKPILTGEYSHFLPVILCLAFVGFTFLFDLNLTLQIAGCLVITLLWYTARFGYENDIRYAINNDEYDKAQRLCESAIERFPTDSFALVHAALVYAGNRQYEKAILLSSTAIEKGVRLPLAYVVRATAHVATNNLEEAESDCSAAFNMLSSDTESMCYFLKAEILTHKGRYEEAIENLTAASMVHYHSPHVYINRAENYCRLKDFESAQHDLDLLKHCKTSFSVAATHCIQARLDLMQHRRESALENTTAAVTLIETPAVLASHGFALLRNEKLTEALPYLDKAISMDRFDGEAFWFRAELHEKLGNTVKANLDRAEAEKFGYLPYL